MSLTRVDCHYYTSKGSTGEKASSFVVLNPLRRPGTIVAAGSAAHRENIASQVACRLALDHFVECILDKFAAPPEPPTEPSSGPAPSAEDLSVDILETAFRRANSSVYSFGHKLAAGGRMAASLIGLVVSDKTVAAARAGDGTVFLFRRGELFPFFELRGETGSSDQALEQLVGAHSLVSVELASVPVEAGDLLLLLSTVPNETQERRLPIVLRNLDFSEPNPSETVVRRVFQDDAVPLFALLVHMGPEAIYLTQPIAG